MTAKFEKKLIALVERQGVAIANPPLLAASKLNIPTLQYLAAKTNRKQAHKQLSLSVLYKTLIRQYLATSQYIHMN